MEQGDILRIIDVQEMEGYTKPILNVYHFHVISMDVETPLQVYGAEIAVAFGLHIITPLREVQSIGLTHVGLQMLNLSNQSESYDTDWPSPLPGVIGGDFASAQLTYSFRLQRYSRLLRNGRKSIAGVPEQAVTAGRLPTDVFVAKLSSVATALSTPIFVEGDASDATLNPLIVRVPANPGVVPTQYTPVVGAAFRGFGSMNTRKQM